MENGLHSSNSNGSNGNGAGFTLLPALALRNTLTDRDRRWFESSFITSDLANEAGIVRVDTISGAELIGRQPKAGANYAGLVFPYRWPGGTAPGGSPITARRT